MTLDLDFLLVQKMRMGDEKAFEDFVAKYYPRILKYCQIHVKDQGYAEDLTQETFTRFFRSFSRYEHSGKAANYLYTIASHLCQDYYKHTKEFPCEILPDSGDQHVPSPEELLSVSLALDTLPQEIRDTAILFFVQGCRQTDISKILGISLPLVKYRVRKAKELLSIYFQEYQK